jgi:hypothetical protein
MNSCRKDAKDAKKGNQMKKSICQLQEVTGSGFGRVLSDYSLFWFSLRSLRLCGK